MLLRLAGAHRRDGVPAVHDERGRLQCALPLLPPPPALLCGPGIREGGRTGVTAIMVSIYFLIAMFFTPIM